MHAAATVDSSARGAGSPRGEHVDYSRFAQSLMNKNGVIAVVVVVAAIVLVGLWAMRSGEQGFAGADCSQPPSTPTDVRYTKAGNVATLHWAPPPAGDNVTTYVIEAGSVPGATNQGTFLALPTATSFDREAPPGTYYVRLFARNGCGTSAASNELTVVLP